MRVAESHLSRLNCRREKATIKFQKINFWVKCCEKNQFAAKFMLEDEKRIREIIKVLERTTSQAAEELACLKRKINSTSLCSASLVFERNATEIFQLSFTHMAGIGLLCAHRRIFCGPFCVRDLSSIFFFVSGESCC